MVRFTSKSSKLVLLLDHLLQFRSFWLTWLLLPRAAFTEWLKKSLDGALILCCHLVLRMYIFKLYFSWAFFGFQIYNKFCILRELASFVNRFIEIMAPVFSRNAWRCVWHMIQVYSLICGLFLRFSLMLFIFFGKYPCNFLWCYCGVLSEWFGAWMGPWLRFAEVCWGVLIIFPSFLHTISWSNFVIYSIISWTAGPWEDWGHRFAVDSASRDSNPR